MAAGDLPVSQPKPRGESTPTTARGHPIARLSGARTIAVCTMLSTVIATIATMERQGVVASASRASGRLDVPSLHLRVPLDLVPCDAYSGPSLPPPDRAFLVDCSSLHGFYGIVGRMDGVLEPLLTAQRATEVHWRDREGHAFSRALTATLGGAEPDPDGTWPGHGVPPGLPVYIAMRSATYGYERQGTRHAIPSQVVIDTHDQEVNITLEGEHADRLDRRIDHAHFVDPEHFSFRLLDMALSMGPSSVRYDHSSGAVAALRAHASGDDLLVTVGFRRRMSTFQIGIAGGFEIGVDFG